MAGERLVTQPVVLLLSDDRKSARAIELLLFDWGYRVVPGAGDPCLDHAAVMDMRPIAIISDAVHASQTASLVAAHALRAHAGAAVPILLCTKDDLATRPDQLNAGITVLAKPVDPRRVRLWLDTMGQARRAS